MAEESSKSYLFFLAVVIDGTLGDSITDLKTIMSEKFGSKRALNSPPHITVMPPFRMSENRVKFILIPELIKILETYKPFDIELDGFDAFPPKVLYIKPTFNQTLNNLYDQISKTTPNVLKELKQDWRSYHPHVTIAFKDLTEPAFWEAWAAYKNKPFQAQIHCQELTLLTFRDKKWKTAYTLPLAN